MSSRYQTPKCLARSGNRDLQNVRFWQVRQRVNPPIFDMLILLFLSAKVLVPGEPNVSYICSRYYRAPELIFGATNYTLNIDIWSTGCVMAEMLLGQPFFPGDSGIDQLVEIIKILGTPTKDEIAAMNASYVEHRFPQIKPHPLHKVKRDIKMDQWDIHANIVVDLCRSS